MMVDTAAPSAVAERVRELCRQFKLPTLAAETVGRFSEAGHADALETLLEVMEQEAEDRRIRRVDRLRRTSKLPAGKTWETFEHDRTPVQLRQQLQRLGEGDFVDHGVNVLAFGMPGTGKTHAMCAIGHRLVESSHSVLFIPAYRLVQDMLAAKRDLELPRILRKLDNFDLLVIDDLGYLPQGAEESEVLFTLIARVGETLTAGTSAIADADGMSGAVFSYQWLANGADIAGATNNTYTLVDTDVGKTIKVWVIFTDNADNEETLTSEATAAVEPRPNSPATGAPTISGTARVGETLTADTDGIEDDDGLDDAVYSYQWLADGADISGATGETYTPAYDDQGKVISVKVSFIDDRDFEETLTSEPTAAVEAEPDAPTEPPNAPRTVRIVGDTNTSLTLTWDAPEGGTAVTEYRVQWLTVGEGFANARRDGREAVLGAAARSHTITGLTQYGFYQVRVLAVNGAGESEGSNTAWGFPGLGEDQYGP